MQQVRLGILGAGRAGMVHARNAPTLKRARVTAVCDPVETSRNAAGDELPNLPNDQPDTGNEGGLSVTG